VALLTRIGRLEGEGESRHLAFSAASSSILCGVVDDRPRWVELSGGIFQSGTSGSPVYLPNGDLVGVIVRSCQYAMNPGEGMMAFVHASVVAPLYPHAASIRAAVEWVNYGRVVTPPDHTREQGRGGATGVVGNAKTPGKPGVAAFVNESQCGTLAS
jgi:hypothetical protein